MSNNWQCPFCGHHSVIAEGKNFDVFNNIIYLDNKYGYQCISGYVFTCSNEECREFCLNILVSDTYKDGSGSWRQVSESRLAWALLPEARVKIFPDYIPQQLLADYREACLIRNKSPKASATLARRCLQGIIRDFWGVKNGRLVDEIEAIKDKVDSVTWEAIDSLRKLGNIGAHMEGDVNLIIDVDSGEAGLLIELLETLFQEWYITRHDRAERMAKIKKAAEAKKPGER